MLCEQIWGKLPDFDLSGKTVEYVDIEWHEAFKKIHKKTTDHGTEIGNRHAPLFWGEDDTFITIYNEPMLIMLQKIHGVTAVKAVSYTHLPFRQDLFHLRDRKLSVEARLCQRYTDFLPVLHCDLCDRFSKEFDRSALRFYKAEHQADRRALSCSVFSDESGDSSLRDFQRKFKIEPRIRFSDILHFYHVCLFLSCH